ncbi:MAG: ATP-binding protein [Actinoplanes sp.]
MNRTLGRTLGFSLLYVLATYAGRMTVMDQTNLSLVWPAAGILAVWFVAQRQSRWRWVDAAALTVITLVVNTATGASPALSAFFAAANLAQAYVFVALFRRLLPDLWVPGGTRLTRLAELWRFIAVAFASTAAGAAIGPTGLWLLSGHYSWQATAVWLARNTVSILLIGVAAGRIGWLLQQRGPCRARTFWRELGPARRIEYMVLIAASTLAYFLVFFVVEGMSLAFGLIALTVWAGVRLRTSFVIFHDLLFGTVAILFTLAGHGPFAEITAHPLRALVAQLFVGTVAVIGLALALGRDERDALVDRLRDSERAAVEQAGTLSTIVDAMSEGLGVIDENGKFRLRNPAAVHLLGVSSTTGAVGDAGFYGLHHPDGTPLPPEERLYRRILAGDFQPTDLLVRNSAVPEGRIIHVSGAELPPAADGLRQALVVFHDVTADRRHRDELAAFAGVVSHDLLNPLTTVEGWSEALAADLGPDDRFAADSVARIQRAAARMRSLINGLLAYTTARDATLSPTAVDLDGLVRDIATARLDQAESMSAPMPRFDLGELATVDADPLLTRQLLENLIANAIKYTAPGVIPLIAVRTEPTGDGFVRISVDDNGIGIPVEQQDAIFQNFHRAHAGGAYAGTGLGLAICKRIVERHGGTIAATGNDIGGSRMTFTLPVLRAL